MRMVCLAALIVLVSCMEKKTEEYLKISPTIKDYFSRSMPEANNKFSIVYYYSGDCSICYGNILSMSEKLPEIPLIILSSSSDTVLISSYIDKIQYKGKVMVDSGAVFFNNNQAVLKKNKILLIDSSNKILAKSEYVFDNKAYADFKAEMN